MLMPSVTSNDSISCFALFLSSPSILLEMPPVDVFLGSRTRYLPAKLRYVVNAAPLFPRSSLSTCIIISFPTSRQSRDVLFVLEKISVDISLNCRNPCLVLPKFMNAASRLGSTRDIFPLYIFDLMFLDGKSISKSISLLSSMTASLTSYF